MHQLSNTELSIIVNNSGAELYSILDKKTTIEYLWNGDSAIWGRRSPVLFPIVGKLKENTYSSNGNTFSLPQHGFARDMDFLTTRINENQLCFTLESTIETLKKYPYQFKLEIFYTLKERKLTVQYKVTNTQESTIYFSIGAHPGFSCNLFKNDLYENYSLEFEKKETLGIHPINNGCIEDKTIPFMKNENSIPLSYELFKNDALVMANYQSDFISLKHKTNGEIFKFHFAGYPFLGIWSKPGPFVCIEPWYGIADMVNHDGILEHKVGIQTLDAHQEFSCEWAVEFNSLNRD